MNVLVACEESQAVCIAFRERGHRAFSCDIQECSGGHPEWHIQGDVLPLLNGRCTFQTADTHTHTQADRWDLIIAHPPCTYLTVTGNRWFNVERYGEKAALRIKERESAAKFFMEFINADCEKIAVENPIGYMSTYYEKPQQIIQPYQFGHAERKATCLWLKDLPELKPTEIVEPIIIHHKSGRTDSLWHFKTISLNPLERAKERSKTFPGIAKAMAEQWGTLQEEQITFDEVTE